MVFKSVCGLQFVSLHLGVGTINELGGCHHPQKSFALTEEIGDKSDFSSGTGTFKSHLGLQPIIGNL